MPILKCSPDNNDPNSITSLEFILEEQSEDGKWLNYQIVFHIGTEKYIFKSKLRKAITHTGMESEIGKFAFSLEPVNEWQELKEQISKFINGDQAKRFVFEPSDPSFEFIIERTGNPEEFKIYFWVDAGNTNQLEYTWDGIGLRFITNKEALQSFLTT